MKKTFLILAAALLLVCFVSCVEFTKSNNGTLVVDLNLAEFPTETNVKLASVTDAFLYFDNNSYRGADYRETGHKIPAKDFEKGETSVNLPSGAYYIEIKFAVGTDTDIYEEVVPAAAKVYGERILITEGETTKGIVHYRRYE